MILEESDNKFIDMEKCGCTPNSRMLNAVVMSLFLRGDLSRVVGYLSKIDEMEFSLEASTTML